MSGRRRAAVGLAAATAGVVLVVALGPNAPDPARGAHTAATLVTPAADTGGQNAPSEQGARAAALAVATASQDWLYLGDADMAAAVRAVATLDAGPGLAAETVGDLGRARDALAASPGRVWWVVRPLATHLEHYGAGRARVVVWTVSVLSAAGVALPQADWARVAVDLVWEDGAWRCQAVTATPGPTPAVGAKDRPWQAGAFDDALDGFERVGTEGGGP